MLDLGYESNIGQVIDLLNDAERKQLPFALATAMTRTAYDIRGQVVADLPERFNLRNNWTKKGIRVKAATKHKLEAQIYTLDWYMQDQEEGGTRHPRSDNLWIPTLEARRGGVIGGKVLPKFKPKKIIESMEKPRRKRKKPGKGRYAPVKPFVIKAGSKRNNARDGKLGSIPDGGIFIRKENGPNSRTGLVKLYSLKSKVEIPKKWDFGEVAERISDKQFAVQFGRAMADAMADQRGGRRATHREYTALLAFRGNHADLTDPRSSAGFSTFADTLRANG